MKVNRATVPAQEIHAPPGMWPFTEESNKQLSMAMGVLPNFRSGPSPMAQELRHFIAVLGPLTGPHIHKISDPKAATFMPEPTKNAATLDFILESPDHGNA